MEKNQCLARLCHWSKTKEDLHPRLRVGYIRLCENEPEEGNMLCEQCKQKKSFDEVKVPTNSVVYGLLTEPIPDTAKLYGSIFYKKMVELYDITPPSSWLIRAKEAHELGEERARQWFKLHEEELEEGGKMPPKKTVSKASAPLPKSQTLLKTFTTIKTIYVEKAEQPKQLPTEQQGIWKQELGGELCWVSESNHVFLDNEGDIGEFLGKLVDGKFVTKEEL